MNNGVYGIAGLYPDRKKNDGVINSEKELYDLLAGIPEGEKLIQILSRFALKENTPTIIPVENITELTAVILNALRAGDIVTKNDQTGAHAYTVSYRSENGLCLTYCDCENVETVAYEIVEGVWTYQSTDITPIHE